MHNWLCGEVLHIINNIRGSIKTIAKIGFTDKKDSP